MDAAIEKAKQDWESQAEEAKRQAKLSPEEKAAEEQKKKDEQIAELQAKLLKSDLQKKQRHPWKRMVIRSAWLNCWIIPVKRLWKRVCQN